MTLLEMVQAVLAAISSDSVNSISDTIESMEVAYVIRDCYTDLVTSRDDWQWLKTTSQLTSSGDADYPTRMSIPATISAIDWIKYNKKDVKYLTPKQFKDVLDTRVETADVVDANGYVVNRDPIYWTTYDDNYIWFDGYNSDDDTTLMTSKSFVYGTKTWEWTMDDEYTPLLPSKLVPAFLAECKAEAFSSVKQQANPRQERKAKRGRDRIQKHARLTIEGQPPFNEGVNYGRK